MNLAYRDIRHSPGRFFLTAAGLGLLLMIVLGMGGIYRGLVVEATQLVNEIGADLWVVQRDTRGPFAETSRVPAVLEDRIRAVPGVKSARRFVYHTIQRQLQGRPLRMTVMGLSWPQDTGHWLPLAAGRVLQQGHYEAVLDASLGVPLGEPLHLGHDVYRVVGLTRGLVAMSGDGMAFFSAADAAAIQFDRSGEGTRLEREARRTRARTDDLGRTQPAILERAGGPARAIPALGPPDVSAALVQVAPGARLEQVAVVISAWPDVSVLSSQDQRELLLSGVVGRARQQLGLFRILLGLISGIILTLILYTLTLDKLHDIALLKLIGASNATLVGMILQQALILSGVAYAIGYGVGWFLFPHFPRRVLITPFDVWTLGVLVVALAVLASLLGIWKALQVEANEVLS